MNLLADKLRKNAYNYTKHHTDEDFYVYAQHLSEKGEDQIIAFEVFERKEVKARTLEWGNVTAHEAFPSDEAFGIWAFSIHLINRTEQEAFQIAIERGGLFKERKQNRD